MVLFDDLYLLLGCLVLDGVVSLGYQLIHIKIIFVKSKVHCFKLCQVKKIIDQCQQHIWLIRNILKIHFRLIDNFFLIFVYLSYFHELFPAQFKNLLNLLILFLLLLQLPLSFPHLTFKLLNLPLKLAGLYFFSAHLTITNLNQTISLALNVKLWSQIMLSQCWCIFLFNNWLEVISFFYFVLYKLFCGHVKIIL